MKPYVVLARKWRSQQFQEVVGQTTIIQTLMNAIRTQRIHQAYLFTGSRGIGKTSIARIFAKAIRCPHREDDGQWIRSCNQCSVCEEITRGNSVDVLEIDGASNNGVDAIREIRENAKFLPAHGERKIYLIDEVHMLTTSAFNALLKTLEEPPAHVVFIFATTEPHKIPATVLSRVQRFDFQRISAKEIQSHLKKILSHENLEAEAAALALVARAADGSLRDALSLLDQVIAFSSDDVVVDKPSESAKTITATSARESIGLIEARLVLELLKSILGKKPKEALSFAQSAFDSGHDLRVLVSTLIEYLHALLILKLDDSSGALVSGKDSFFAHLEHLSKEEFQELRSLNALRSSGEIEAIFDFLHEGLDKIARSSQPKILLDVLLIRCTTTSAAAEKSIAPQPDPEKRRGSRETPTGYRNSDDQEKRTPLQVRERKSTPLVLNPKPVSRAPVNHPVKKIPSAHETFFGSTTASNATPNASPPPTASESQGKKKLVKRERSWKGFVDYVKASRRHLAILLENATRAEIKGELLELEFKPQHQTKAEQLKSPMYKNQLLNLLKGYFGLGFSLSTFIKDSEKESPAEKRERVQNEEQKQIEDQVANHPVIKEAKALFGGELGPIVKTKETQSQAPQQEGSRP